MYKDTLKYINNKDKAILLSVSIKYRVIIWLTIIFFIIFFIWLYFCEINQLTRAYGKVIPSKKTQIVQNLEGGIISKIYVSEGSYVNKGDILIKLDDTSYSSTYQETIYNIYDLKVKKARLEAEMSGKEFKFNYSDEEILNKKINNEKELYKKNIISLNQKISIAKSQLAQIKSELAEQEEKILGLDKTLSLVQEEVKMKENLLNVKVGSKIELNLAKQKLSSTEQDLLVSKKTVIKLEESIEEKIKEIEYISIDFQNKALEELTKVKSTLDRLEQINVAKKDIVNRTFVRSPIKGIINRMLVNTEGEVVKPAQNMVEITPLEDILIIETKVRPSDIAFIHTNQEAIIRLSAYDFTIYGSLKGKVTNISADTIEDKIDNNQYYIVHIQTYKSYLGNINNKLNIIPGMITTVDIIGDKRTLLQYILKPILKAKENFLSKR